MPISLRTPEDRNRLDVRDKAYFVRVSDAVHLGYKKGKSVSRWIVRWRVPSGYICRTLRDVVPDDHVPADERTVLSYEQALMRVMNMNVRSLGSTDSKRCGLCGNTQAEVKVLFAGVSTFVCDECIRRSSQILLSAEPSRASADGTVEVLLNAELELELEASALKRLLDRTAFAMGKEDSLPFNGLLVEVGEHRIRAVATDGHHLAISETPVRQGPADAQNMILARDGVLELQSLLASVTGHVWVAVRDNRLHVAWNDDSFAVELLFGSYPNYRSILPDHRDSLTVNRADLLSSIAAAAGDRQDASLRVAIAPGSFALEDLEGDSSHTLDVDYRGKTAAAVFTTKFLSNVIRAIVGEVVRVWFDGGHPVWRFESTNDTGSAYLVMSAARDVGAVSRGKGGSDRADEHAVAQAH